MKINAKTVIIVALVAAAVYFVWRKLKESKADSAKSGPTPGSLDYILANVPFTAAEIRKINAVNASVNASTTRSESVQAKAAKNGLTFDEQVVLDAIWLLYNRNGKWIAGPDGKTDYGWKLQQKVINLK